MTTDEKVYRALHINRILADKPLAHFEKIYPFTTENIKEYIGLFNMKNTSLLTLGSSLDQTINASLFGCRNITVIDICPYTKEYYYLKRAAMMSFDLETFKRFLFLKYASFPFFYNSKVLNKNDFEKLADTLYTLDEESYKFWERILSIQKGTTLRKRLFTSDEYNAKTISRINPYLSSEELYEKAKSALQDTTITIRQGNIIETPIEQTFDNIFLSNMACYYSLDTIKELTEKLSNHLNEEGKILISYLYDTDLGQEYIEGWSEIYNQKRAMQLLPEGTTPINFTSVNGPSSLDGILVYQKKK